jgi:ATPase
MKYVPDTSAIIDGVLSRKIENKEIKEAEILVHNAVLAELEAQANYGREVGFLGLEELQRLKEISKKNKKIILNYVGKRPKEFEIKYAKAGEIDAMIRELALKEDAYFVTLDKVDAEAAKAQGIKVIFIETEKIVEEAPLSFEKFFDEKTMSVHLRENMVPTAKKGEPGNWKMIKVGKKAMEKEEVENIAKEIIERGKMNLPGSFIETERKRSTIAQIKNYRIVITKPPFSDGWEITIVRPIKKLSIKDYNLPKKLMERFETSAAGILISGAPGHGKTTFAEALAEFYMKKGKIVKTVEAPRDLRLPIEITQYSKALGSIDEIRDVLLLSRPDYTIFDEMRNNQDFLLYSDLRLAGVGMIGVVHATSPIDSIQRFVKRVELGMIPSIVDTVVFIENGKIAKVYSLNMTVKVPSGMTESDLARPLVEIRDFFTGEVEYEMYSYGEETVVIPVTPKKGIEDKIRKELKMDIDIKMEDGVIYIYADRKQVKRILGRGGKRIRNLERRAGMPIEVIQK